MQRIAGRALLLAYLLAKSGFASRLEADVVCTLTHNGRPVQEKIFYQATVVACPDDAVPWFDQVEELRSLMESAKESLLEDCLKGGFPGTRPSMAKCNSLISSDALDCSLDSPICGEGI